MSHTESKKCQPTFKRASSVSNTKPSAQCVTIVSQICSINRQLNIQNLLLAGLFFSITGRFLVLENPGSWSLKHSEMCGLKNVFDCWEVLKDLQKIYNGSLFSEPPSFNKLTEVLLGLPFTLFNWIIIILITTHQSAITLWTTYCLLSLFFSINAALTSQNKKSKGKKKKN